MKAKNILKQFKTKIFLEVGVYKGATSTKIAQFFKETEGFENSYVISMDTWLLDIRFQRLGIKSSFYDQMKSGEYKYFEDDSTAGASLMYYQFLANCIATNTTDRIIPMQTAAQNGAMILLSHGLRPDFIYIDASHANPDVFIDYENFFKVLKPAGVIAVDDLNIPAVRNAFDRLVQKYKLAPNYFNKNQGYVVKEEIETRI